MSWVWTSELAEWSLFETDDTPDGYAIFATFTEAKRALIADLRGAAADLLAAARDVEATRKADVS